MTSLRAAITAAVPELAAHPARLKMWIEKGSAQCRQSESFGFTFSYRLCVYLEDLATDIAIVSLALFGWLRVNQVDLLSPGTDGFTFDADVLDNGTVDVMFLLKLTEDVAVTPRDDGKFDLAYQAEPDPMWDDFLGAGGAAPVPPLAAIVLPGGSVIEPDA
jgi:hypothetical protein